ncbi:hypothetical protein [Legionella sp.]|uniref:hypothetical protein n=1 Tax=Legionella sp. TaxID=459 RepID=UPI000CA8797B|nr:hypothetical protein [Legionella sp.]PJE09331.1 MAG: hypothetical protein CK430_11350 [Legionella sp.]
MKLYYRADTRLPETIFAEGFQPKNRLFEFYSKQKKWWIYGLRQIIPDFKIAVDTLDIHPAAKQTMDAESHSVICMTSEFEAAPIFPVLPSESPDAPNDEIYVYVLALPDAILPDNEENLDIEVFDLHSLQIQQAEQILRNYPQLNPAFVTQGLCGYEAFAKKVESKQIICAVKCKRSGLLPMTAGLIGFSATPNYALPFDRTFQLGHEIFYNSHYEEREEGLKEAAIKKLCAVKQMGIQPTKNVMEALKESGIEYDETYLKTSTLFWHELVHLNFMAATSTVFESLRYFFISLYRQLTGQSFFDPEETSKDEYTVSAPVSDSSGQYTKSELLLTHGLLGKQRRETYSNDVYDGLNPCTL